MFFSPFFDPDRNLASYGDEDISPQEKQRRVGRIFGSISERYDLMNDAMSAGLHRLWKKRLVASLELQPRQTLLDLAGGTGDVALQAAKDMMSGRVWVCDRSKEMMACGRRKAFRKPDRRRWFSDRLRRNCGAAAVEGSSSIRWVRGDAEQLPFSARVFDACSLAFGLRNMNDPARVLTELHRVLKPGGRLGCLEFSGPVWPVWSAPVRLWNRRALPFLGRRLARNEEAYRYLEASIRRFPSRAEVEELLQAHDFVCVRTLALGGGIAALFVATRA